MQTRRSRSLKKPATYSTHGVLPVPPSVRLPTLTTGTPARTIGFSPQSYRALRIATIPRYDQLAARSAARSKVARIPRARPLTRSRYRAVGSLKTARHGAYRESGAGRL